MQKKSKGQISHTFVRNLLFASLCIAFVIFIAVFLRNLWLGLDVDKKHTQVQINSLSKKLDALHQQTQVTSSDATVPVDMRGYTTAQIKDAYLLVRAADATLQHNHDIDVAKQLLQLAEEHLSSVTGPKVEQAKKILSADQAKLNAVQLPNMNVIQEKLSLLDRLINVLPPYKGTTDSVITTTTKATIKDKSSQPWYSFFTNMFTDLKSVVKVRKKVEREINVTDVDVARAQFKLIVEQLRWAAFYHNNDVYQRSINNAQELLPRIFDMQSESAQKFEQTLHELQKIQFNTDIPNLQNSINALQAILVG